MYDYLDHAMRDNGRIELRHQTASRWLSGLYDDLGLLRMEVKRRANVGNLFTSINAPRLVKVSNAMDGPPLTDGDIAHRTRLPFDFDPVRPVGLPSTIGEMRAALAVRDRMAAALMSLGWPLPALAESGNGAHAVYRIRLPISAEWSEMLRTLYLGMKSDFGSEEVDFDTTVRNPGRIWRLYGTTNRKGVADIERPHRAARIQLPPRWIGVSPRRIEALVNSYARRPEVRPATKARIRVQGSGDYSTLDVAAWFTSHACFLRYIGEDMSAVVCPWSHEHSTVDDEHSTSSVIWTARGRCWPNFRCQHAHCESRGIRDVMALWGDADSFCGSSWRTAP